MLLQHCLYLCCCCCCCCCPIVRNDRNHYPQTTQTESVFTVRMIFAISRSGLQLRTSALYHSSNIINGSSSNNNSNTHTHTVHWQRSYSVFFAWNYWTYIESVMSMVPVSVRWMERNFSGKYFHSNCSQPFFPIVLHTYVYIYIHCFLCVCVARVCAYSNRFKWRKTAFANNKWYLLFRSLFCWY